GRRWAAGGLTRPVTPRGKVMRPFPDQPNCAPTPRTASATALGVAGCGVSTLTRSRVRAPAVTSAGATLIPEPPMSIPRTSTAPSIPSCSPPGRLQAPARRAELADGVGGAVEPYPGGAGPAESPQHQLRRATGHRDHG